MKKDLLETYNKKRNLNKTKEPAGKALKKKSSKLVFVVQEHHASRLHYDLRLEWEGVLKSWAVPKGPSEDPSEKRLAVQTEDHPLGYEKFHGTIPKGEYGGGEMFIWDSGTWEPDGDADYGFQKGHLQFTLKGKKLKGKWHLVRTHYKGSDGKNWLLMKAQGETEVSAKPVKKVSKKIVKSKKVQPGLGRDPWPDFIAPQLPRLVTSVPPGESWVHEMKFDGYRIQLHLKNSLARFFTRSGLDWSNSFPHLLESAGKIDARNAILDGEIVALDEQGRSHFQNLQNSLTLKKDQDLRLYVFDLLYLDGNDLRHLPLIQRKELLTQLLKDCTSNIIVSEHFVENGDDFYHTSCSFDLEGIVSKLADSPYRSGRNDLWAKTKCTSRQEFVIGGYTEAQDGRTGLGALLLGIYEDGQLKYAGKVGTGFNNQTLRELKLKMKKLKQEQSPFKINSPKGQGINWVKPRKIAEVSFSNWTNEGVLRTPVFMGLRKDKPAKDIGMEIAKKTKPSKKTSVKKSAPREVTSPEKILFKKEKITKHEVADFYQAISKEMLPYLADRPLSLVRCPEGSEGTCFFQKHVAGNIPESFHTFPLMEDKGEGVFLSINSPEGLRELVQINAFELHAWNCHAATAMRPDQIVMDFDPDPAVPWKEVVSAAFELKAMLEDLKLKSFVKLTGGKGLHVHIPIAPLYDWEQVKSFSQTLALQLVSVNPDKYIATMSKKARKGKIFVDYLRNGYGATAVVPYSLRAKPTSAVALPIEWTELKKIKSPQEYTIRKALKKIKARKADPWKGMLKLKQKIQVLKPLKKLSEVFQ